MIFPLYPCRMSSNWRGHFVYHAPDGAFSIRVAKSWANMYAFAIKPCPSGYETNAERLAGKMNLRRMPSSGLYIVSPQDAMRFVELYSQNFDAILV